MRLRVVLEQLARSLRRGMRACLINMRGIRTHISAPTLAALLTVIVVVIGVQVWAYVTLSRRAVETSEAHTNRNIARIFAERLRRFSEHSNRAEVYKQIEDLARLNPSIRLYILDQNGIVKASPKEYGHVVLPFIDVRPVRRFLASKESGDVVYGDDPLQLRTLRPISVEPLRLGGGAHFLYVVLGEVGVDRGFTASITSTVGFGTVVVTSASISLLVIVIVLIAFSRLQRLQGAVASLSHDLRSPLSSIQGYLETLLHKSDTLDAASSKRFVNVALRSTRTAATLVDDLHHLSKLEASGEKPEMENFSLSDLLMDITMSVRPQTEEKRVELAVYVPPVLPLAHGNVQLIERLLRNLLQNGVRYTPEGGKVEVTALLVTGRIRVTVSDSGVGIPESEMSRITSPFFRATNAKIAAHGSGLGLSIASAVAKAHGSELRILSREGEGTAVIFELPQATASSKTEGPGKSRAASAARPV